MYINVFFVKILFFVLDAFKLENISNIHLLLKNQEVINGVCLHKEKGK
jgi:hypothetical protein